MEGGGELLERMRRTKASTWCKRAAGGAGGRGDTGEGGRRGEVAEADVIIEVFFRWARGCRRIQLRGNFYLVSVGSVMCF